MPVWQIATKAARAELRDELQRKRMNYLERSNSEMSREERQRDPTYQQAKALKLPEYQRAGEALRAAR
jgi:hypothetical protein